MASPDEEETLTARITMPKIDLSITNPDGEKAGKDEFKSKDGIVVMLPETSEEDPVYSTIEISAISPSALGGNYQFSWDTSKLEVFEDQQGTKRVEQTKDYDATRQWTFYVRGSQFSDARDDQEFKVRWISGDKKTTITDADILRLTVVKIEMTLHAPGTKAAPGQKMERPSQKDQPYAGILVANNDDDDARGSTSNPKRDNDDETLGSADNDLVEVELDFLPHDLDKGTLKIEFNSQTIRAFTDQGTPLQTSDLEIDLNSPQGKLSGLKQQKTALFLEGLEPHKEVEELKFTFKRKDAIREDKALLLPVELKDIKDHGNTGDDAVISNWTAGQAITDASIAWIEAHKSATDNTPRMPQLVFNIPGVPQGLTLEAKLLVEYERPYAGKQADDTVKIPADGSFKSVTNGRWELWNEYSDIPFFGGGATLTYKINGGEEQTIRFAIGGRNPDDSRCKAYTQGRTGTPWYAYAIEKHESQAYNPGFYNQFWERSGNSSPINSGVNYTFTKGDSLVVRSNDETGVGGAGLAQVTGANGVKTVSAPREIFWNWQKNVDSFLNIMAGKIQIAEIFMNDTTPRSGPGSMPNGQRPQTIFHTGQNVPVPSCVQGSITFGDNQGQKRPEDAVAIKAYNGAAAHWCSWRGPSVHEWQFNYGQNNYVEEVCNQVEGAQP